MTGGDTNISDRWAAEYYLPQFEKAIKVGGVREIMTAHVAVNGVPPLANEFSTTDEFCIGILYCFLNADRSSGFLEQVRMAANRFYNQHIARDTFGFTGLFTSDW